MRSTLPLLLSLLVVTHATAATPPPTPDAAAWTLVDFESGAVLASHDADRQLQPASVTKVMTAYIVAEALTSGELAADEKVKVSEHAWRQPGTRTFLEVGSEVPVMDLVRGMAVESGNDAAVALAERLSGSEAAFAERMDRTAQALGMHDTHFVNATGLPDPHHLSSAHDLALLAIALIREHPDVYAYFSLPDFTWNGIRQRNKNGLLRDDPTVDGLKTGYHEAAGYCIIASAVRDGRRLIAVTLDSPTIPVRRAGAQGLLDWGFAETETHRLYDAGQRIGSTRVWKGAADEVALGADRAVWVTVPTGRYDALKAYIDFDRAAVAPVAKDAALGTLRVTLDGDTLVERPLHALAAVPEGGVVTRIVDSLRLMVE